MVNVSNSSSSKITFNVQNVDAYIWQKDADDMQSVYLLRGVCLCFS